VSPRFDLVVRNGTLVIPGVGTVAADVGICGSRIAAIGGELSGSAQEVFDAGGKIVLP
jgi:dihydroorotase-like cyclic amidohydrolase